MPVLSLSLETLGLHTLRIILFLFSLYILRGLYGAISPSS